MSIHDLDLARFTRLGSTELMISRICFGCFTAGGHGWGRVSDDESRTAILNAFECGINFFDTADVYGLGHSEEMLSTALQERRQEALIATKCGVRFDTAANKSFRDSSCAWIRSAVESSLRRLSLDTIPLLYLHYPDPHTPIEESCETLAELQREGKIRHVGLSNFSLTEVKRALQCMRIEVLQIDFNLSARLVEPAMLKLAREHQLSIVAYGALAQGLFSGKYTAESQFGPDDSRSRHPNFKGDNLRSNLRKVEQLREIGERIKHTPAQVAIRWVLDTPEIASAIVGMRSAAQVNENIGVLGWSLSQNDYESLRDGR